MSRKSRNESAAAAAAAAAQDAAMKDTPVTQDPPGPGIAAVYRNDERDNALNEIIEDRKKLMEQEAPAFEPDPNMAKESSPEPEIQPRDDQGKFAKSEEPVAEEKVKLVVDGEEIEMLKAEVDDLGGVSAAQKSLAADKRLKEAKETIAASKAMQAQMGQFFQAIAAQRQQPVVQKKTLDDFLTAETIQKIQLGTPDEGIQALKQIINAAVPQIDTQQLVNTAVQQSLLRSRQEAAAEAFKKEFGDILANPMVYRLAAMEENTRLQKGVPEDWNAFYRGLGNELRGAFGGQHQSTNAAPTEGNTSQKSEKEARKATIVNLPTAGSRASPQEDPKPKSREEILNEARKARGLPVG